MGGLRRWRLDDPYADETVRQVAERASGGLAFFLGCVFLSTCFEIARFPERTGWMLGFAGAFVLLAGVCQLLVRRHLAWSIVILVAIRFAAASPERVRRPA